MSTLIGESIARPDAFGKVTGQARYPGDLVQAGMLHLKVVFARRPHARIRAIDSSSALAYPGVVAVLSANDIPYNAFGLIEHDQPVICGDLVRFEGDKVAVVVAESPEAAEAACKLITVIYEDLPVVSDARAAMAADAPLVHPERGSNILFEQPIRKGDAARALAEADVIVEGEFHTSWQEHAFLQPEAGIAYIDDHGRVVVETAGQWLHEDRKQIAQMLQIPEEQVVIRYASIGGAFGGREDLSVQHILALAAWKLKRSVAIVWDREESMIGHHKRHPISFRCRWGAKNDGTITAIDCEVIADGGAYASTSAEVSKVAALFASGCYEVPNIDVRAYAVYTNNIPSGAFRGFGAPQAHFASEIMIDRLAEKLQIDPLELRRINLYREGSIEPTQNRIPQGVSVRECLDACVHEVGQRFSQTPANAPSHLKRGVGIACGIKNLGYSFGYPEQSTATVEILGGATMEHAHVRAGAAEVGQGTHLILRQIAAEVLGLPFEKITMITDDSSEAPNAGSASASRLTLMAGRAVHDAALAAKQAWEAEERPAKATVQFRPPATTPFDPVTTTGTPNYAYGYTAQAVEVEVNTLTGQVRVLKVISVHDVGRAINRQQVEGQIEGCVAQAIGYALMEHFQMRDGRILTPHFSNYLLPTALDMDVEITPVILELADTNGPFGARGMAEMPLVALAPAVAIAIHNATGAWLNQQPMIPERVLQAIHDQSA
jgi:CO/xanthine dehydrogenase Mo-binding subunit